MPAIARFFGQILRESPQHCCQVLPVAGSVVEGFPWRVMGDQWILLLASLGAPGGDARSKITGGGVGSSTRAGHSHFSCRLDRYRPECRYARCAKAHQMREGRDRPLVLCHDPR